LRGLLITIGGIDGAGKSTLCDGLLATLSSRMDVVLLREPGGVEASERLRSVVKDPGLRVDARAEALIYAAARAQLVDELLHPRLDAGTSVILDRFVDSSYAYQGFGRGLGMDAIKTINRFATDGLMPDVTLYLHLDPEVALARLGERGDGEDRLERELKRKWDTVVAGFKCLAELHDRRIITLDATVGPEELLSAALEALEPRLDR
jgi:dTMP kinase